jgi:hypothetical protein
MDFVDLCKSEYNDSQQLFNEEGAKLFFTHFGEFDSQIISDITTNCESHLFEIGAVKRTIKNSFNILIEGLQNIINHGELSPNKKQLAYFNIGETKEFYVMNFSNLILIEGFNRIKTSIDQLNSSDKAGIKAIYIETLTNGQISAKGGAGLGIITMAMKSKNKIDYQLAKINDELSILSIEVKINKF